MKSLLESIGIDSSTNEKIYKMLVQSYAKSDLSSDVKIFVGISENMDNNIKEAWVKTIYSVGDDLMAVSFIYETLNHEYIKKTVVKNINMMTDSQKSKLKDNAISNIDKFMKDILAKSYMSKQIGYQDIMDILDEILYGEDGGEASLLMLQSAENFKKEFLDLYEKYSNVKNNTKVLDNNFAKAI